jgi:hypothetical protein
MSSLALKGSLSMPEPAAVSHRGKRTPSDRLTALGVHLPLRERNEKTQHNNTTAYQPEKHTPSVTGRRPVAPSPCRRKKGSWT